MAKLGINKYYSSGNNDNDSCDTHSLVSVKLVSASKDLQVDAQKRALDLSGLWSNIQQNPPPYIQILQDEQWMLPVYERAQFLKTRFEQMVIVGIGGSHLGAESFLKALVFLRNVTFLENPDPVGIVRRLQGIQNWHKTHFVFVSKSGSTFETLSIANWIVDQLNIKNLSLTEHCTVVTVDSQTSALRAWAKVQDVQALAVPEDLSGRYSVLSPAGLLPIYFGLDLQMQDAAIYGLPAFAHSEEILNYASLLWVAIRKQYKVLNFWNYSDQMQSFGKWWRQLWSESLGHQLRGDMTRVPVCVPCRGASDQHSYLQQVIDQPGEQLNIVLSVKNLPQDFEPLRLSQDHFQSQWGLDHSTMQGLFHRETEGLVKTFEDLKIPYIHLEISDICFGSLAYFVIQQQLTVALLGHALGIDPYTQPAVEQMKLRIKQMSNLND